jgi:hypothetical protein
VTITARSIQRRTIPHQARGRTGTIRDDGTAFTTPPRALRGRHRLATRRLVHAAILQGRTYGRLDTEARKRAKAVLANPDPRHGPSAMRRALLAAQGRNR